MVQLNAIIEHATVVLKIDPETVAVGGRTPYQTAQVGGIWPALGVGAGGAPCYA